MWQSRNGVALKGVDYAKVFNLMHRNEQQYKCRKYEPSSQIVRMFTKTAEIYSHTHTITVIQFFIPNCDGTTENGVSKRTQTIKSVCILKERNLIDKVKIFVYEHFANHISIRFCSSTAFYSFSVKWICGSIHPFHSYKMLCAILSRWWKEFSNDEQRHIVSDDISYTIYNIDHTHTQ